MNNQLEFIGPLQPYRPSNATEGCAFESAFCDQCEHDKPIREGLSYGCSIHMDIIMLNESDPEYPREVVIGGDGRPTCKQYLPEQDADHIPRCHHTLDIFEAN